MLHIKFIMHSFSNLPSEIIDYIANNFNLFIYSLTSMSRLFDSSFIEMIRQILDKKILKLGSEDKLLKFIINLCKKRPSLPRTISLCKTR